MNTGMQDAINLAWKLALVVQQKAKPDILDSYTDDRSPVAKQVLADSGRLTSKIPFCSSCATWSRTMFLDFPRLVTQWLNVSRKHSLAIRTVR